MADYDGTLLVVDDTRANIDVLREYLNGQGYRILVAQDGETALKIARKGNPDVILLDVMMPGIDGFETCARLKADPNTRDIPVIFMTALSNAESKVQGFEVGAVDYVTKPLEQREVVARVRAHLQNHRYATQLEALVSQRTEELERANAMIRLHERRKNDFIRIMSHELRTPMSVVYGYASMLGVSNSPEIFKGIQNGSERLKEIIGEIIDVAWLDAESVPVEYQWIDLSSLIQQWVFQWKKSMGDRSIDVRLNLNLPKIEADPEHLKKVMEHLFLNAVKYTPDGGQITITGTATEDSEQIEISIRDTGVGIDPQDRDLIFSKFYQNSPVMNHSSGKSKFMGGGPGLGLTIVKGLVEAHHGNVSVQSDGHDEEKFPGSTFTIRLPIHQTSKVLEAQPADALITV